MKIKRKKTSVKKKLIQSTLGLILLLGSIASIGVYMFTYKQLRKSVEEKALIINREQIGKMEQAFRYAQLIPNQISKSPIVISYLENKSRLPQNQNILNILTTLDLENIFSAIYIMDPEGTVQVSTYPDFVGNNYSYRDYYKDAINNGFGRDMVIGATSKEPGYYFSQTILNEKNEILGIAIVKMKPDILSNILYSEEELNIQTRIVDRTGVIIYSSKTEETFKSLGKLNDEEILEIKESKRFSDIDILPLQYDELQHNLKYISDTTTFNINDQNAGEHKMLVLEKIKNSPFYLFIEFDESSIITTAQNIGLFVASFVAVAAFTCLIFISFVITKFLKPLNSLKEVAQAIKNSNFNERIKLTSNDEFSSVGTAINEMLDVVQASKEKIEKQVKKQTKQINEQNNDLAKQQFALLNLLEDVEKEKKISELRAQDLQKFAMAVENASDHIVITNPEGIVIFANKAVTTISGYSNKEVVGKKAGNKELWGGLMPIDTYKEFWKTIKINKKTFKGEFKNKRKNGQEYIAFATVTPVLDKDNNIKFFVGIERDITKAKEVDRMKTEFISLASHQLRTPLSAMKWFLEMLLNGDAGKLKKEQLEFINNINLSNERMIALVNSLLNVSRIESGRIIVDPEPTDLKKLVDELVVELQNKIEEKNQTLLVSANDHLPLINVDPKLIRNVYMNLLTNAIKYTPMDGEISVYISKKEDKIISQVSDNGHGIPKEEQDKLFKKFFRASNIIDRVTDGNGLGLYLVKAIIDSSGGEIWFQSEKDKGTSFWFSLPLSGMKKKKGEVHIDS